MIRRLLAAATLFAAGPVIAQTASTPAAPQRPKLVVAISIDQFAANLFAQYRSRFTGGLARLAGEGVVFPSGYQSHAATETCPGHSTILTGRHPAATGIVANSWYDVDKGRALYCVEDQSQPVPGRENQGRGPANLKVSTLGEWMKAANPASRVFGVSGKDRAAIMMTGHNPDGVFWWDDENGFSTSVPEGTTAEARLAPVAAFNGSLKARWAQTPPRWDVLDARCAVPFATRRYGQVTQTEALPPTVGAPTAETGVERTDPAFKGWLRASPVFDQITLDLATRILDQQKLGRGAAPDLLAISLSATDYVGHRYGNGGPEMCDQLAHLDRMLGAFLDHLAALKLPVVVVLTADHGAMDAPERAAERGAPARRIDLAPAAAALNEAIKARLHVDFTPLIVSEDQVRVSDWITDPKQRDTAEAMAVAGFARLPGVAQVLRARDVAGHLPPRGKPADELTVAERYAESTDLDRSGSLFVVPDPDASFYQPVAIGDAIAGHGSPWDYDRRVPILFWWPGAAGFEQPLPVETVDIAPTLATLLGIRMPAVDGRCLDLDRTAADSCAAH